MDAKGREGQPKDSRAQQTGFTDQGDSTVGSICSVLPTRLDKQSCDRQVTFMVIKEES